MWGAGLSRAHFKNWSLGKSIDCSGPQHKNMELIMPTVLVNYYKPPRISVAFNNKHFSPICGQLAGNRLTSGWAWLKISASNYKSSWLWSVPRVSFWVPGRRHSTTLGETLLMPRANTPWSIYNRPNKHIANPFLPHVYYHPMNQRKSCGQGKSQVIEK